MTKQWRHDIIAGDTSTALRVYAIRLDETTCPALDWLRGLTLQDKKAIGSRLRLFAERGWLQSPDAFNQLDSARGAQPRVDEIKHSGQNLRLYVVGFAAGAPEAYVTHGSTKPKSNRVSHEVARAREIYMKGMSR